MTKKSVVLDATVLTSLMSCPRYMDLRFNRSLVTKEGKGNSLSAGSLVHHILEWYHRGLIDGMPRDKAIEQGFQAGKEFIHGPSNKNKFLTSEDHQEFAENLYEEPINKFDTGWKFIFSTMEEYFDYYRNDSMIYLAAEDVRRDVLYEDDDIQVGWKAKYDSIVDTNAGIMSMDHKTMKMRKDTMTMNNQFMGQCFLLRSRNVMINKIGFQKTLKTEEKFTRVVISYTYDRIAEWANEIVPHYARMLVAFAEADYYPPNLTHCENKYGMCEFYKHDHCNVDRGMREEVLKINFKKGKEWDI